MCLRGLDRLLASVLCGLPLADGLLVSLQGLLVFFMRALPILMPDDRKLLVEEESSDTHMEHDRSYHKRTRSRH